MTQLVLGTAQFGTEYGAMNTVGRLGDAAVQAVSTAAVQGGVEVFDTSSYYGDAQGRLGEAFEGRPKPRFISKFGLDGPTVELGKQLDATLRSLRVDSLEALLFHRVDDLRDPRAPRACQLLREARAAGLVKHVGASIYDSADLEIALELMPDLDILQLPANALDRRLLEHPMLDEFHRRGGLVHVRSAYLQGVLLAPLSSIPGHLSELRPAVAHIQEVATERDIPLIELLLGFLKHHPLVDAVVVGALTAPEMRQTLSAWNDAAAVEFEVPVLADALLDPRRW